MEIPRSIPRVDHQPQLFEKSWYFHCFTSFKIPTHRYCFSTILIYLVSSCNICSIGKTLCKNSVMTLFNKIYKLCQKSYNVQIFSTVVSGRGKYLPKNLNKSRSHCISVCLPNSIKRVSSHILNFPNGPKSSYLKWAS